ncbi:MAG TPA: DUF2017 family protein [Actinomycetota bacterium]|jgi:hypothetical protein|nr:DUF2017 family protein [Actinomycetota bacterium]
MASGRVKRTRDGGYRIRLPAEEREVLRGLPGQLRELLREGDPGSDPGLDRLFPSAFPDDPEAAREFDAIVRADLMDERMRSIATMERTLDASRLRRDELEAWLTAINDLRLVLGVRLGVTEESDPGDFDRDERSRQAFALYAYLSYLEEDLVAALSNG